MDEIDLEILKILKDDARAKYVDIARKVKLTEGAVRRRVRNLVKEGVIRRFTIETSVEFEGIVLIKTEPTQTDRTRRMVERVADRVFEVSGDYDIAAHIRAYTMEELNRKVDEIRGLPLVLDTNTLIKLRD